MQAALLSCVCPLLETAMLVRTDSEIFYDRLVGKLAWLGCVSSRLDDTINCSYKVLLYSCCPQVSYHAKPVSHLVWSLTSGQHE